VSIQIGFLIMPRCPGRFQNLGKGFLNPAAAQQIIELQDREAFFSVQSPQPQKASGLSHEMTLRQKQPQNSSLCDTFDSLLVEGFEIREKVF
jgi:hypothetical protein